MASTNLPKTKQGYGYKYTELAQVNEYLESKNISYYQFTETDESGTDFIYTVPIIDNKELPARRGCRIVNAALSGKSNAAQEQGSAITYARRYSLLMAFGLATEDDDAQSLTRPEPKADPEVYGKMKSELLKLIMEKKLTGEAVAKLYNVKTIDDMNLKQLENAVKNIDKIIEKVGAKNE